MKTTVAESVHVKNTEAFVNENAQSLVVTRHRKEDTPTGGFKRVKVGDIPVQKGRIVMSSQRSDQVARTMPDGQVMVISATLVAVPGFDVKRGDWIKDEEGTDWQVGEVSTVPKWRVSAELGRHG